MKTIITIWLISAVLAYGITLGSLQNDYISRLYPAIVMEDCRRDAGVSAMLALVGGPASLVITFFLSGFAEYGLQFTCPRAA